MSQVSWMSSNSKLASLALSLALLSGCTVNRSAHQAPVRGAQSAAAPSGDRTHVWSALGTAQPSSTQIPVGTDDPVWGAPTAPVTIVEFTDLECPFCARVAPTIEVLKQMYGPAQLRLVFKHNPLPFHAHARKAA